MHQRHILIKMVAYPQTYPVNHHHQHYSYYVLPDTNFQLIPTNTLYISSQTLPNHDSTEQARCKLWKEKKNPGSTDW